MLADKAYGSRANRAYLRRRGIRCTIPDKADQVRHRKPGAATVAARPPSTPKLQAPPCRGMRHQPAQAQPAVATRYDKLAVRYEATLHIAAINEWLLPHF